ncbi:MAG: hypothetical protein ACPIOQ_48485, partial [Promethearchaeia archaeon]
QWSLLISIKLRFLMNSRHAHFLSASSLRAAGFARWASRGAVAALTRVSSVRDSRGYGRSQTPERVDAEKGQPGAVVGGRGLADGLAADRAFARSECR